MDFKNQRTHLQLIAVIQGPFAHDARAIDERAVAAAEVAHGHAFRLDAQQAMLPADPFAIGSDVALRPSAEQEFAGWKEETLAFGASVDDEQLDVHCTSAPLALAAGGRAARRSAILP